MDWATINYGEYALYRAHPRPGAAGPVAERGPAALCGRVGVNLAYAGGMACIPSVTPAIRAWPSWSMSSPDRGTDVGRWRVDRDGHQRVHGVRRLRDPVVGGLSLTFEAFVPADDAAQTLRVFTAEPGIPRRVATA
jgi:hypothetical protein